MEPNANGTPAGVPRGRKKKSVAANVNESTEAKAGQVTGGETVENHQQTQAEVERQLLKRTVIDLIPERAPATVPAEMFSNEPSLDSEPNDHLVEVSSPTHVAAEECVPMEYSN